MRLFAIKTGDRTIKVRKEDFGCIILDRQLYVEGNETVFDVLELFSQGKTIPETIQILSEREKIPLEEVKEDVLSLMEMFKDLGWFLDMETGE